MGECPAPPVTPEKERSGELWECGMRPSVTLAASLSLELLSSPSVSTRLH